MTSLVDRCLTGADKFQNFLDVIDECKIKTGYDFAHFMSVIQEHCLDKGITDYNIILKTWQDHKDSLKNIGDSLKNVEKTL